MSVMAPPQLTAPVEGEGNPPTAAATPETGGKKKGRTNTPWTAEEEQRLKAMRDAGNTWSEIAKVCPTPSSRRRIRCDRLFDCDGL